MSKTATVTKKATAAQGFVDQVFADCMSRDVRELSHVIAEIRRRMGRESLPGLADWWPTDHQLQIMVSRNAMGHVWRYFPAYSRPPRYVSVERVRELTKLVRSGKATEAEAAELRAQREDLVRGVKHWRAAHAAATKRERELAALLEDVDTLALEGTGHD